MNRNLVQYYIYDIITNYWFEGGTTKIHKAAKPNRYLMNISDSVWNIALDSYFAKSMLKCEAKQVPNPKSADYVLLNCIYLKTFTAMDQLSLGNFDVEHIAPKKQMKQLIEESEGEGLPISCIANLCYLPEFVNRSKRDRNFYQDKKYLEKVSLTEVEEKYSFTDEEDLEWMNLPYESNGDFEVLKEYYEKFCISRFEKMKQRICESLDIQYEKVNDADLQQQEQKIKLSQERVVQVPDSKRTPSIFRMECVSKVSEKMNLDIYQMDKGYKTIDKEYGFVFATSRAYPRKDGQVYWFAYRKNKVQAISDCKQQYYVLGCGHPDTILLISVEELEKHLDEMNVSTDEDGNAMHYHIKIHILDDGRIEWVLSHPDIHSINIQDKFLN